MDFKQWEDSAASESTIQVNRETVRDVYAFPNGIRVYHDVTFPWNVLKGQQESVVVDYALPVGTEGVKLTTDWYTPDGFGLPIFNGEGSLQQAFEYAETLKKG